MARAIRQFPLVGWVLASPFLLYALFSVLSGGYYVLAVMTDSYLADRTLYPATAAEAHAQGVWLDTVHVQPRRVRYGNYEVTFQQAWLYQVRTAHRPAWDEARVVRREPRAVFHLAYTARYLGAGPPGELNGPWLAGPSTGGHSLVQATSREQVLTIPVDLLTDDVLGTPLPLVLELTGDQANSTRRLFASPGPRWLRLWKSDTASALH